MAGISSSPCEDLSKESGVGREAQLVLQFHGKPN